MRLTAQGRRTCVRFLEHNRLAVPGPGVLQYTLDEEGGEIVEKARTRGRQAKWDRRNLRTVSTHVSVQEAARFGRWCRSQGTTPYHELRWYILKVCGNERMREIARGERWD